MTSFLHIFQKKSVLLPLLFLVFLIIFAYSLFLGLRTGPFGIGIPAKMIRLDEKSIPFSLDYPATWVAFTTPQGNHGDNEVIGGIGVPGRSLPQVRFAVRNHVGTLNQVVEWGYSRIQARIKSSNNSNLQFLNANFERIGDNIDTASLTYSWMSRSIFETTSTWQCIDYYMIREDKGLAVTFCSDQKDWKRVKPVFDQMISSFKWR